MTTFEPGASDVLTHGLLVSPRATALRASRPAASMTDGLEVFVQLVIAAITTCPLSMLVSVPSSMTTKTRLSSGSASIAAAISSSWPGAVACSGGRMPSRPVYVGGSDAGKESASNSIVSPPSASSPPSAGMKSFSAMR